MTLYEAWQQLNVDQIHAADDDPDFMAMPQQTRLRWTMKGTGFGLPDTVPPYYAKSGRWQERVSVLWKRYVQPDLWTAGCDELAKTNGKLDVTRKKHGAVSIYLQRRVTGESQVLPAGGGCLISLVFWRFGYRNGVQVYARASEITKALFGDLYFVRELVANALKYAGYETWELEELEISWHSVYGSQKNYMVPLFLLFHRGEDALIEYYTGPYRTKWERSNHRYFWRFMMYPERISWPRRRKWAEIIHAHTDTDLLELGRTSGKLAEFPDTGKKG